MRSPHQWRLVRARDFLLDEALSAPSLDAAARQAGLSKFAFLRHFSAAFGETPHAYVTRLRLARAQELLVETDLPVTDICLEVGFSSLGSFSALFARRVGATPSGYRRRVRRLVQVPDWVVSPAIPFCFVEGFLG
jgi:AraC-like DNA-binding protein